MNVVFRYDRFLKLSNTTLPLQRVSSRTETNRWSLSHSNQPGSIRSAKWVQNHTPDVWRGKRSSIFLHYSRQANLRTQITPRRPHQRRYFKIKQQTSGKQSNVEVKAFPIHYPGTPFSPRWRHDWTIALGTERTWTAPNGLWPQQEDLSESRWKSTNPLRVTTSDLHLLKETCASKIDGYFQVSVL